MTDYDKWNALNDWHDYNGRWRCIEWLTIASMKYEWAWINIENECGQNAINDFENGTCIKLIHECQLGL